jgi:hypothetical protein
MGAKVTLRKLDGSDGMKLPKLIPSLATGPEPDGGASELDVNALAATSIRAYTGSYPGTAGFDRLVDGLAARAEALSRGEVAHAEGMLLAQAYTLNALFHELLIFARENNGSQRSDDSMKLALRVQNQCRATLDTLMSRRAPMTVIANQANVTSAPQQINNAMMVESRQNELLEQTNGHRLDPRATQANVGADQHLEAVGAVHRPEDGAGQEAGSA